MVALRIELSATRLSAVSWQPALDYRLSRAPRSRTCPRRSRRQNHCLLLSKQACYHLHLCPISCLCKSERLDSNQRSRGPRPRAITRLRHVLFRFVSSSSCRSRTQPARLERPMTSPEVQRAVLCAHCERGVGREVLEPSSAVLQTAADHAAHGARVSATSPSRGPGTKKPDVTFTCDTGLIMIPQYIDRVSQAQTQGRGIRPLVGETTFTCLLGFETRS